MNAFLVGTIIFAIGVAILVGFTLGKVVKQKKNKQNSNIHYSNASVEYTELWQPPKEVVSSERIKLLKEKELEKKAKEAKETEVKHKQDDKEKKKDKQQEVNKTSDDIPSLEEIRPGEVQRTGHQQFNLRKDEQSTIKSEEDGQWWI